MNGFLLFIGLAIVICVLLSNAKFRVGIPVLAGFLLLGLLAGFAVPSLKVNDAVLADICTVALILTIFCCGFVTRWRTARAVAWESGLLATVGVIITAGLTGLFCRFILNWDWLESFLMGSVLAATDASSIFSILRTRRLSLKRGLSPLLEMESGASAPGANILTLLFLYLLGSDFSAGGTMLLILGQFGLGVVFGLVLSTVAVYVMRRISFHISGFDLLFVLAVAVLSYVLPTIAYGNGYISTYIVGIVLGNATFKGKKRQVSFFDGVTGLMQIIIFFLLGLMVTPERLALSLLPALSIFFVLLLAARPVSLLAVLLPFRKYRLRDIGFLSVGGVRGSAAIVFAVLAAVSLPEGVLQYDIINVVFCVVFLSICLQGGLMAFTAGKFDLVDKEGDVDSTFTDYAEETRLQFVEHRIDSSHIWCDKAIKDIELPREHLFCLVLKSDGTRNIPTGMTVLKDGDTVISASKEFDASVSGMRIERRPLSTNSRWEGRQVKDYPARNTQLMLIQRGAASIIPHGNTVLRAGDILYINRTR